MFGLFFAISMKKVLELTNSYLTNSFLIGFTCLFHPCMVERYRNGMWYSATQYVRNAVIMTLAPLGKSWNCVYSFASSHLLMIQPSINLWRSFGRFYYASIGDTGVIDWLSWIRVVTDYDAFPSPTWRVLIQFLTFQKHCFDGENCCSISFNETMFHIFFPT